MNLFRKLFGKREPHEEAQGEKNIPRPTVPSRDYTQLPHFKYHLDPLATESICTNNERCICCGQTTGYIYTGPVYAEEELNEQICPWCIADGYAHECLDATFTDEDCIGGGNDWIGGGSERDGVPEAVIQEIVNRTPGFSGWQQERWWAHCGDAAAFLGRVGKAELLALGEEAEKINYGLTGKLEDWDTDPLLNALDRNGSPTFYLFRCLHCGRLGGYADCD